MRRYIEKMTGLSRAQVTRLIARYTATRPGPANRLPAAAFSAALHAGRHRAAGLGGRGARDLERSGDAAHSGARVQVYGKQEYARLAGISVGSSVQPAQEPALPRAAFELRQDAAHGGVDRRAAQARAAGPARLSAPGHGASGRPAGRRDKGVYHINAVDEVTQWQVVGATPRISEAYLEPVLEAMLRQFPFRILGFHTDNGSEFINHTVAELLNKLLIEQTKSRPRQSGDNGLVETKNGAVIRKHIGYGYIDAGHADRINGFYREYLNPYLNYHRPCAQADVEIDEQGPQTGPLQALSDSAGNPVGAGQTGTVPAPGTQHQRPETRRRQPSAIPRRRAACNKPKASCSSN